MMNLSSLLQLFYGVVFAIVISGGPGSVSVLDAHATDLGESLTTETTASNSEYVGNLSLEPKDTEVRQQTPYKEGPDMFSQGDEPVFLLYEQVFEKLGQLIANSMQNPFGAPFYNDPAEDPLLKRIFNLRGRYGAQKNSMLTRLSSCQFQVSWPEDVSPNDFSVVFRGGDTLELFYQSQKSARNISDYVMEKSTSKETISQSFYVDEDCIVTPKSVLGQRVEDVSQTGNTELTQKYNLIFPSAKLILEHINKGLLPHDMLERAKEGNYNGLSTLQLCLLSGKDAQQCESDEDQDHTSGLEHPELSGNTNTLLAQLNLKFHN